MSTTIEKPIISPVIAGRLAALEALQDLVCAAQGGAGQVLLVSGEAGIGKSRLVAEAKALAAARGFLFMQGACFQQDRSCPYAPLLDLLYAQLSRLSPEQRADELGHAASNLQPLLPELMPALPSHSLLDPEQEKRRIFAGIAQYLLDRTEAQPLLLVVEDLHWSDDTSLEFLLFLARRTTAQRLLVLLTYRSDETHPALLQLLGQLDRERLAHELVLERLCPDDVHHMVRAILGLQRSLHPEFLDTLCALTEGNPFFVEEMIKSLLVSGDIAEGVEQWDRKPLRELRIPRSVQEAVRRRVVQLSEQARDLLALAAVAGRRFDFALLQALTQHDEQSLLQLIKHLIAAQLVVEESAEQCAFRHALTREAIYSDLLARERQLMHQRIAETIEQIYCSQAETRLAELAYHWYQAGAWERALDYSERAGQAAARLFALQEAVTHYSRALEAAAALGAPRWKLYSARGHVYELSGDLEGAGGDYQATLDDAQARGDREGEWQGLIDLGFFYVARDYVQAGAYFKRALGLARLLEDASLIARSLNRMGNWHLNVAQSYEAQRCHQEALAIFEAVNDKRGIAETLDLLSVVMYLDGDVVQCLRYCEQAVPVFEEQQDLPGLIGVLTNMLFTSCPAYGHDCAVVGSIERPPYERSHVLAMIREIGWRAAEALLLITQAQCLGIAGDFKHAIASAQRGLQIAEEIDHRQWAASGHFTLGRLYLDLLALAPAQQHLEQGLELAQSTGSQFWIYHLTSALASTYILQSNIRQAERLLAAILPSTKSTQALAERQVWAAQVELCLAQGDSQQALEIIDRLLAAAPNLSPECRIARLEKLRAEALIGLQRLEEAEAALEAAEATALGQGARPLLWRIQVERGTLFMIQGRQADAAGAFAAAHSLLLDLAGGLADAALQETFLRRATKLLPRSYALTPRRLARQAFHGLTNRERQVAALVAQGKSNRDIAEELVVSERTVETHVSNILSKLSFTSRKQLVTWSSEKGLS